MQITGSGKPNASSETVLVVGGGIGGLMTALTLARSGYAVHLLEQAAVFAEVGAGVQLGPNATRILQEWNLLENLENTLVRPDEVRILDAVQDRLVGRMPLGKAVHHRFGAPYAVIHRGDLHTALLDACLAEAGITIETGQTIVGYAQSSNGVELQTDEGRKIPGAALVGADGLWSTVRRQMLGDGMPDYAGHTAYRALVGPDAMPDHGTANATTLWAGPGMHLVHYPVSGGERYNVIAICENTWRDDGWHGTGTREEVVLQFQHCCDRLIRILEASPNYGKWALADRPPARTWSDGRVTLLGDAAHPGPALSRTRRGHGHRRRTRPGALPPGCKRTLRNGVREIPEHAAAQNGQALPRKPAARQHLPRPRGKAVRAQSGDEAPDRRTMVQAGKMDL